VEKERIRERERKEGPGREGQVRETMRDLEKNKNKQNNQPLCCILRNPETNTPQKKGNRRFSRKNQRGKETQSRDEINE